MSAAHTADTKYESYLRDCGFDDAQVAQKLKERDEVRMRMANKTPCSQGRVITCSSYERAQKYLFAEVHAFVAGKAGAA